MYHIFWKVVGRGGKSESLLGHDSMVDQMLLRCVRKIKEYLIFRELLSLTHNTRIRVIGYLVVHVTSARDHGPLNRLFTSERRNRVQTVYGPKTIVHRPWVSHVHVFPPDTRRSFSLHKESSFEFWRIRTGIRSVKCVVRTKGVTTRYDHEGTIKTGILEPESRIVMWLIRIRREWTTVVTRF